MNTDLQIMQEHLKFFTALDQNKTERLYNYLAFVLEANQQINLTSITNWEDAVIKHLFDSLTISKLAWWTDYSLILDLGSGAGFPGIPLAITYPEKNFHVLEASKKKADFLKMVKHHLNLENLIILNERAETLAHQPEYREQYKLVVARAVAELPVILELAIPFCQNDGIFVAFKGPNYSLELEQAERAIQFFGVKLEQNYHYQLPLEKGVRTLLAFKKIKKTPEKFPRKAGIPAKRPLH